MMVFSFSVTLQIYSMAASAASVRPPTPPAKWKACHLRPPATHPSPPFRICLQSEHELERRTRRKASSSLFTWSSWCRPLNHCFTEGLETFGWGTLMSPPPPAVLERTWLKTLWAPAASQPSWMVLGCCVMVVWDTEHWTDCFPVSMLESFFVCLQIFVRKDLTYFISPRLVCKYVHTPRCHSFTFIRELNVGAQVH